MGGVRTGGWGASLGGVRGWLPRRGYGGSVAETIFQL